MKDERSKKIKRLEKEVLNLPDSELIRYRRENNYVPVIGGGSYEADIMFVGEAPGKNEALSGVPFCGSAGKILDELLGSVGLERESVYITSIVLDRPPKNRDPRPEEIELYAPFLDRQIEVIRPKVIVTLGRFSMQYIMSRHGLEDRLAPIGELHGQAFDTTVGRRKVRVVPLYHPAAVIYNQKLKVTLLEDFRILKNL